MSSIKSPNSVVSSFAFSLPTKSRNIVFEQASRKMEIKLTFMKLISFRKHYKYDSKGPTTLLEYKLHLKTTVQTSQNFEKTFNIPFASVHRVFEFGRDEASVTVN